jgi:hypothetical protein
MATPYDLKFKVGGLDGPFDASVNFITDVKIVCYTHEWAFEMFQTTNDDLGTYTILVDQGSGNFKAIDVVDTDVLLNEGRYGDVFPWTRVRISYTANGQTGTVDPTITFK